MNDKDKWKELGIDAEYDPRSRQGKLICAQMQEFRKALIDLSQDIIKKIMDRFILF
jgi:hypothetical protein